MKPFTSEKMLLKYYLLGYQIDLHFPESKYAIEVDEKGHKDRNKYKEIERQKAIEKELNCEFIIINTVGEDFDMYVEIGKIYNYIDKSTKKSLIDKISKRLLELQFKSDHSIKSKFLKRVVKNFFPSL